MKRFLVAALAAALLSGLRGPALADDPGATAVLDKAIKALGGEEKLGKVKAVSVSTKGTITVNGEENPFTAKGTYQSLDHYRGEFSGEFGGNTIKVVTVLKGGKGWRKINDDVMDLDGDALANDKRTVYLQVVPSVLLPLKSKDFKVESAGEEKVGDKPAVKLKVTAPDGKDFTLCFDKESGLPVKLVARVLGFGGEEFTQETTFADYKDFGGIKRATKVESKRDGERFVQSELVEFKVLDTVPPGTFDEPA
jgi:hypothetical protein